MFRPLTISPLTISLVLTVALTAALARAADPAPEMVPNPAYTAWAACKPESTVTTKQDMDMGAMKVASTMTQKLLEVTPDGAKIEVAMSVEVLGQKQENKQNQTIPAKVEKGKEHMPPGVKGSIKETGNEKIDIAGK